MKSNKMHAGIMIFLFSASLFVGIGMILWQMSIDKYGSGPNTLFDDLAIIDYVIGSCLDDSVSNFYLEDAIDDFNERTFQKCARTLMLIYAL